MIKRPLTISDIGVGTVYERYSLFETLSKITSEYHITTALEYPNDGMTGIKGINSLFLADFGIKPSVVLQDQKEYEIAKTIAAKTRLNNKIAYFLTNKENFDFANNSFDLVWNFNALPLYSNYEKIIDEMICSSRKYIFISVSNKKHYGFFIHYLHHKLKKEDWSVHGNNDIMNISKIEKIFKKKGCHILQKKYLDIPWWPDVDKPIEEVLSDFFPFLRKNLLEKNTSREKRLKEFFFDHKNMPYFDPKKSKELKNKTDKHNFIEKNSLIRPLHWFFAHHESILIEK